MRWGIALAGLALAVLIGATVSASPAETATRCHLKWRVVPSPGLSGAFPGRLETISRGDVWLSRGLVKGVSGPVVFEHWNGKRWRRGRLALQASGQLALAASSSRDVWFAGSTPTFNPLLLHYDGRSWKTLPAPSATNEVDLIYDLAALAPDDAWAVGLKSIRGVGDEGAFTWHWDGVRWTSVPPPPGFASLAGLAAVATDDIWGVASSQENEGGRVLLAHWDGTSWQSIDTGLRAIDLSQALAVSSKEFWAVGSTSGTTGERGVIAHWDGHSLRRVFTERRSGSDVFFGVAASGHEVWAVGYPTIEHWDGRRWRSRRIKGVGFSDVGALSPHNVWAVGATNRQRSVIYHYACA